MGINKCATGTTMGILRNLALLLFTLVVLSACNHAASTDTQDQPLLLVANKHSNSIIYD